MGFRTPQTIRRKSGGHMGADGIYVPGSYKVVTIMASVQPLNRVERAQRTDLDTQGSRTANMVKVYTDVELYPDRQATAEGAGEADVLIWRGRVWKCIECEPWQSNVISHFKGIFQEVDDDALSAEDVSA